MNNCCHFLYQFIFVSLFVYFCLCCFIVCLSALPFYKRACFFYVSKPRYLLKRMFHFMVRMLLLITCSLPCSFLQALRARQKEALVISSISDIIEQHVS